MPLTAVEGYRTEVISHIHILKGKYWSLPKKKGIRHDKKSNIQCNCKNTCGVPHNTKDPLW